MPPASSPIARVSTVDALADALRKRVLTGELQPGAQLREVELAAEFGVGRHSLRAALQALAHEGLIRHEPHRGAFVPALSRADAEDLFFLRTGLEVETARALVERRADVQEAVDLVERLEALRGDEPWDEIIELDLGFHQALIAAAGSPRGVRVFSSLRSELRLLLAQMQAQHYRRPDAVGADHRLVLDAILSGSRQKATRAMRQHLEVGLADIFEVLGA